LAELLQGTLDVLVLKALSRGEAHGYAVAKFIHDRTGGALLVEEGALYPALHRLERKRSIESEWGLSENNRRARFYRITQSGRAQLRSETGAWREYADAFSKLLQAA
jgi:PadR family transcriptional regulator PadR